MLGIDKPEAWRLMMLKHSNPMVLEDLPIYMTIFLLFFWSPQTDLDWHPEGLYNILNEVFAHYHIDMSRIYCTGFSMGGNGTYLVAYEYPSLFAAIAPVAGWGIPEKACKIKDIPVRIFHDIGDPVIPYSFAQEMENALIECEGDVSVTTYNDGVHGGRDETYLNHDLYDWFLSHKKDGAK